MKHENIVELYDYTENEKEIVLLMEYCNDANYFEEKIEGVSLNSIYKNILKPPQSNLLNENSIINFLSINIIRQRFYSIEEEYSSII